MGAPLFVTQHFLTKHFQKFSSFKLLLTKNFQSDLKAKPFVFKKPQKN
jgi:hypothetical protein